MGSTEMATGLRLPTEMKIHIAHNFVQGPWGGGNQFLKALRVEFLRRGIYEPILRRADCVILNSFHLDSRRIVSQVLMAKIQKKSLVVIHRVDGPFTLVRGYKDKTDFAVARLNSIAADGTVFQSTWSRDKMKKYLSPFPRHERIITNAPQSDLFRRKTSQQPAAGKLRIVTTSWSTSPNKGFDTLQWLDKNLDWSRFEFTLIGNCPVSFSNIKVIKPLETFDLAEKLHEFDIFLSPSRNEPCSNSLIEALHCGLPALVRNEGGSPELLGSGGLTFEENQDIEGKLLKIGEDLEKFSRAISMKSIAEVADEYANFARDLMTKPKNKSHFLSLLIFWMNWLSTSALWIQKFRSLHRSFRRSL